jgi:hypothetical protein
VAQVAGPFIQYGNEPSKRSVGTQPRLDRASAASAGAGFLHMSKSFVAACAYEPGVPLSSEPKRTFNLKSVRANLSALETEMVQRFIHLQGYTEGLRIQQVTSWRRVSPIACRTETRTYR